MTELIPQTSETTSSGFPMLTIRPTRGTLLIRTAVAVVLAGLAIAGRHYHLTVFPWCLAAFAAFGFIGVVRAAASSLRVSPAGLRSRRKLIAWGDVFQIVIVEDLLARSVRLDVFVNGDRRHVRLSVPRSGRLFPDPAFDRDVARLREWCSANSGFDAVPKVSGNFRRSWTIAAVALLTLLFLAPDRPWGWVGGTEASVVPSACALTSQFPGDLRLGPPTDEGTTKIESMCTWTADHDAPQFADANVVVGFQLFRRYGLHSASDLAGHRSVTDLDYLVGGKPLGFGIGSETASGKSFGIQGRLIDAGEATVDVVVRGNVEIIIALAAQPDAATLTVVAAMEKVAIAAVKLG